MEARELKSLINNKGIKKSFIAEKLKVSKSLITQWLNGTRPIADKHVIDIKRLLN